MPDKPILVSKRDFLEQVLLKSHGSSFASDELCENSLSQPRLPLVKPNATISLVHEEQIRLSRDLGPIRNLDALGPSAKAGGKARKTPKQLYDQ